MHRIHSHDLFDPVSYTHLDVYKRQSLRLKPDVAITLNPSPMKLFDSELKYINEHNLKIEMGSEGYYRWFKPF